MVTNGLLICKCFSIYDCAERLELSQNRWVSSSSVVPPLAPAASCCGSRQRVWRCWARLPVRVSRVSVSRVSVSPAEVRQPDLCEEDSRQHPCYTGGSILFLVLEDPAGAPDAELMSRL